MIDTSGSTGDRILGQALTEIDGLLKKLGLSPTAAPRHRTRRGRPEGPARYGRAARSNCSRWWDKYGRGHRRRLALAIKPGSNPSGNKRPFVYPWAGRVG